MASVWIDDEFALVNFFMHVIVILRWHHNIVITIDDEGRNLDVVE